MDSQVVDNNKMTKKIFFILFTLVLCSIFYGFGMFKLIPMQDPITTEFGVGEGAYGTLNSALNWVVIFASIFMGFLARKMPCKYSISSGMAIALAGSLMQVFAPSFGVLVVGRAIEGGGGAFMYVTVVSLLLNTVSQKKSGIWSGVSILCSVGPQVLITKLGAVLINDYGITFRQIFLWIAILYAVAIVVTFLFIGKDVKISGTQSDVKPTKEQTMRVFKDKSNWCVNIAYIFFSLVSISFSAYIIKYLMIKGLDVNEAANTYSYTTIIGMFAMLAFGIISDKLRTKRKIVVIGFFVGALAMVLLAQLPVSLIMIYVVVYGTFPRCIAGLTTASAVDLCDVPSDLPIVNALKNEVTQVGTVVGSIALGYIIEFAGYESAIFLMAVLMAVGGVLWIFAKRVP